MIGILCTVAVGFLMVSTARAQNVLVFDANSVDHVGQTACANLVVTSGYSCTVANAASFVPQLTGGTWDLVVMDMPSVRPTGAWQTPLAAYITGGGKAIQTGWDPADFATLAAVFEVTLGATHNPLTCYRWNTHPLFGSPNAVPATFPPRAMTGLTTASTSRRSAARSRQGASRRHRPLARRRSSSGTAGGPSSTDSCSMTTSPGIPTPMARPTSSSWSRTR